MKIFLYLFPGIIEFALKLEGGILLRSCEGCYENINKENVASVGFIWKLNMFMLGVELLEN